MTVGHLRLSRFSSSSWNLVITREGETGVRQTPNRVHMAKEMALRRRPCCKIHTLDLDLHRRVCPADRCERWEGRKWIDARRRGFSRTRLLLPQCCVLIYIATHVKAQDCR